MAQFSDDLAGRRRHFFSYWLMCSSCDWPPLPPPPPFLRLSHSPIMRTPPSPHSQMQFWAFFFPASTRYCHDSESKVQTRTTQTFITQAGEAENEKHKQQQRQRQKSSQFSLLQHVACPQWPWFSSFSLSAAHCLSFTSKRTKELRLGHSSFNWLACLLVA